jgi:hypothetical protein
MRLLLAGPVNENKALPSNMTDNTHSSLAGHSIAGGSAPRSRSLRIESNRINELFDIF